MSEVSSKSFSCEGCGAKLVSCLFCFDCSSLQSITEESDYFSALGISSEFDVDLNLLEEKFQHIASELHPDFYLNSTPQEKRLSERASTLLNQAYDTLKDPFKRADYLMSLKCKNVKWNDRVLPPTFLQEMFTLQEELDEMLENQDQQGLLQMREVLGNRVQELESGLLPSFRMLDSVEEPETVLEKLQMNLNAERYLRRLLDRIKIEETT